MWLYLGKYIDLIYLAVYKLQSYYTFSILILIWLAVKKCMLLVKLDSTEIRNPATRRKTILNISMSFLHQPADLYCVRCIDISQRGPTWLVH